MGPVIDEEAVKGFQYALERSMKRFTDFLRPRKDQADNP